MDKDKTEPLDVAVAEELKGVPAEFLDDGAGGDASGHSIEDALDALRADLDAAKQDILYAKAEAQNVRRRAEKDVQDARTYASAGFARDILSVADNLSRALEHVPEELRADEKSKRFIEGIEATQRELDKVFAQNGISRIAAMGLPLDPNQHQAMMEIPTNDAEPGVVVQEMQAGYMLRDRLLRPAMVGVARKPD